MTIRSYEENLTTSAEDYGDGLMLKAHVARDMVREFDGKDLDGVSVQVEAGKKYRVRRSMEAMNNPATLASFASAPVLLGHKPIGQYSVSEEMVGFPIGSPHKASEAMLSIQYRLTDPAAIKAYRDGKAVELSPAYDFDLVPAPNGADYDFTMTDVVVDHVAQVERGKNGPTARLYEEEDMALSDDDMGKLAKLVAAELRGEKKDKPKTEEFAPEGFVAKDEADAKLEAYKAMVADQKLVGPLLENDRARSAVEKATGSVEVLAIALGMKRELAEAAGAATLRGQVMERIRVKAEQAREEIPEGEREAAASTAESWENLNNPEGKPRRTARTQEAFSPLFDALETRAKAIRRGHQSGGMIGPDNANA